MEYFDDYDTQVQCEEYYQDDFEQYNQNEANDYRHEYDGYDDAPEDPEWVEE
jgi:hypothetical protein